LCDAPVSTLGDSFVTPLARRTGSGQSHQKRVRGFQKQQSADVLIAQLGFGGIVLGLERRVLHELQGQHRAESFAGDDVAPEMYAAHEPALRKICRPGEYLLRMRRYQRGKHYAHRIGNRGVAAGIGRVRGLGRVFGAGMK